MSDLRVAYVPRDAVAVSGPDAVTYLQGQLSQDVAALEVGGSAWSWLLQPAGKVDALVRVTRTGPEALLVDVDAGHGEAVLNRLTRFKLRTKADLAEHRLRVVALRGTGAAEAADNLIADATVADATVAGAGAPGPLPFESAALVVAALWPGEDAVDVVARAGTDLGPVGPPQISAGEWEAERIVAGVPVMGAELTDRTIPAETGLVAITASFTKGCYTGQELVARIDSRGGNVPRHLRGLRAATPLTPGEELTGTDGKVVGSVTSAALHPELGPVALGYVARSVEPGAVVDGPVGSVTVVALARTA